MSGYEGETRRLQPPCPICQGMTFKWGRINTSGASVFISNDSHGLSKILGVGEMLEARMCEGCGNVQLFRIDRVEL
jgi:hypothetical protein